MRGGRNFGETFAFLFCKEGGESKSDRLINVRPTFSQEIPHFGCIFLVPIIWRQNPSKFTKRLIDEKIVPDIKEKEGNEPYFKEEKKKRASSF